MGSLSSAPVTDIRKAQALKAVREAARKVERHRTWRTVWVPRLAAASIVIAAGSFFAGPGLALVRGILDRGTPLPDYATPLVVTPSVVAPVPDIVRYNDWTAATLPIEIDRVDMGNLEIRRGDDADVSVEVLGASRFSGVAKRGSTVIIRNDGSGAPSYTIRVPSRVTSVTVRVADGGLLRLTPSSGIRYGIKELSAGRLTPVRDRKGG
jgi:hypothetical protein